MFSLILFSLIFGLSVFGTYKAMPHSIRKLQENNYVVLDMYKIDKPKVPTNAGIIILFVSYIAIALLPLFTRIINRFYPVEISLGDMNETNLALLLVVSIYALYGLVDDLVDIGRISKLLLPIVFGFPLVAVVNPEIIWLPILGEIKMDVEIIETVTISDLFKITIIPVYVMVVSNLVNMHSGFNGLQTGLSIIILSTLSFKSFFDSNLSNIIPVGAFLGSMIVLWFFNKFPSKVFEGNIGSMLFGSIIGSVIVIQEYWIFGIFILIPHIFNFFLWILYIYRIRTNPKEYTLDNGNHKKFGYVNEDGTLFVPNNLTLKWFPNYYYGFDEQASVKILYFITSLFCLSGLIIFS